MAASKKGYLRIITRPRLHFANSCVQDAGDPGSIQRLTDGRQLSANKSQTWLLSKDMAHVERGKIVPDTLEAAELLATFSREPVHRTDDLFEVL